MTTKLSPVAQGTPTVHPARKQTVGGILGEIHRMWLDETRKWLAPAMAPEADFWDRWGAVRYLNDQFERLYRRKSAFLKVVTPRLDPTDALALKRQTAELVRRVRKLNSLGRRRGTARAVAAACADLLEVLESWFGETERLTRGLSAAELPARTWGALTQLHAALAARAT